MNSKTVRTIKMKLLF